MFMKVFCHWPSVPMTMIGCFIPYTYYICSDKSLFTRVMACEHERVTLSNDKEVVIEAIGEVHLKMHNGLVRMLRGV